MLVTLDKYTDCLKAQQQIGRSSFIKLNHDPDDTHINGLINGKTEDKQQKHGTIKEQTTKLSQERIQHYIKDTRRETQ